MIDNIHRDPKTNSLNQDNHMKWIQDGICVVPTESHNSAAREYLP